MRCALAFVSLLLACGGEGDGSVTTTYEFGPFTVAPGEEIETDCIQISLNNTEPLYVNSVELTTGLGFHHSNWVWVPEHIFAGEDGTFNCNSRDYSEAVAAVFGGALFAQSTQAPHEVQAFPPGVVIKLPPKSKIISQLHLLNAGDVPIELSPDIKLTTIPESKVATVLASVVFQNHALALPPMKDSRFTLECDIATKHRELLGRDPDFKIYYALAHYHDLGKALAIEAVRDDGSSQVVYSTANNVGDLLGGPIDPQFDMTGFSKLRFYCDFYNPRSETVGWGIGDQEMCVYLAFSDSTYNWLGGANDEVPPENETVVGDALHYQNPCDVFPTDNAH